MESDYVYDGEDKIKYTIKIAIENNNSLTLSIKGSAVNETYSSSYLLENLNEKLDKIVYFKDVSDFKKILEKNISKKTLVLKAPYKSVINSIWKIFPNDSSKNQAFTLISQKSFNKNISLFFYENYSRSEKFVKEVEKQLLISSKDHVKKESFIKYTYESNLFIDNMYFFLGKEENEQKKINNFVNIIKEKEKDSEFRSLLIFFDEDDNIEQMMQIIDKCYKFQIFILILTPEDTYKLHLQIASKINKLSETKRSWFDMNNIFIYNTSIFALPKSIKELLEIYICFIN